MRLDFTALQGNRILKDREIRRRFSAPAEGAPPQSCAAEIVKYTGTLATPEWVDVEPGSVQLSLVPREKCSEPKDKFEELCSVEADISSAPYTSRLAETGKTGYERKYDVILLVGLTELKAQASWIDSETVRAHLVLHVPVYLIRFPHVNLGGGEKVCSKDFRVPP